MNRQTDLAIVRRVYAKQMMGAAERSDPRVEAAFATVPREDFLGPGPWQIMRWLGGYRTTPDPDPVHLYANVLVGIIPERGLNNGAPALHAKLISVAAPQPGEHVVHIGAGAGYYTAILAELVGPSGKVTAIEFDPGLAEKSATNLRSRSNVIVVHGDGTTADFDPADLIYVSAGATRPADKWLDGLRNHGRLLVPLTTNKGGDLNNPTEFKRQGAMFLFTRNGSAYAAQWIMPAAFIPCESARDEESEAALAAAFSAGGWEAVTGLHRGTDVPENACWLRGPGWCLTRDPQSALPERRTLPHRASS